MNWIILLWIVFCLTDVVCFAKSVRETHSRWWWYLPGGGIVAYITLKGG